MRQSSMVLGLVLAAACGGDDDGGDGDGGSGALVLSSSAIDQDGAYPIEHTCEGLDVSPPLEWSGGPDGAAGYGLAMVDTTEGLIHWAMWDIPASVSSVPENIEKTAEPDDPAGAKQTVAYDGATRGWLGPCPPETHDYTIYLYAVEEHPLPELTLESTRLPVVNALENAALATAELRAAYQPQD